MTTQLDYLNDTYKWQETGTLLRIEVDERGSYGVFDRTIFYPQGGGQPADTGAITVNGSTVPISFVGFIEGEVRHYGDFSSIHATTSKEVTQNVDAKRRLTNASAHTAGHLVAHVVESLAPELRAVKGYHFPDGSYVEFEGEIAGGGDDFLKRLNDRLNQALTEGHSVQSRIVSFEELQSICQKLPPGLPKDKPMRIVQIGEFTPLPCGGTHLASLAELKSVLITKAKSKQGKTKVSYSFALR
jgi:Ser-tRNA(Ala) deacylase AlaX